MISRNSFEKPILALKLSTDISQHSFKDPWKIILPPYYKLPNSPPLSYFRLGCNRLKPYESRGGNQKSKSKKRITVLILFE